MVGCVIQGNVRRGTEYVLEEMLKKFDIVIFSTWKGETVNFKSDKFYVIYNDLPENNGITNRNMLRKSTSSGINLAKKLGCEYVCKLRSDMLPLNLSVNNLIEKVQFNYDNQKRLLTFTFRCFTSTPDWYSSIPDLFSFGNADLMLTLWSDADFDYSKSYNIPNHSELVELKHDEDFLELWQAETELYAFFKYRLQISENQNLTHEKILRNYFILIDYRDLNILWFSDKSFRSIFQAWQHPWWNSKIWISKEKPIIARLNRKLNFVELLKFRLTTIIILKNIFLQNINFSLFIISRKLKSFFLF